MEIAELIALLIWECSMDIMVPISCESLMFISFEHVCMDSRILSCLGIVPSWQFSLISFSLVQFSDSRQLLHIEQLDSIHKITFYGIRVFSSL